MNVYLRLFFKFTNIFTKSQLVSNLIEPHIPISDLIFALLLVFYFLFNLGETTLI